MAKVLTLLRTVRNNWKKSVFGAAAFSYGISYGKQAYETEQLMRQSCEDVIKYGDASCPTNIKPRHVTVILNPAAKKRKARKLFEKYCEPLLHLAGISITVIDTQSGNHARNIITNLETTTDAIIVAGGDGTLSDVITGLMRKYENNLHSVKQCPVGILPLGNTNTIASIFYGQYNNLTDVHHMIDATMAIIKNNLKSVDAIEIKLLEDSENSTKPIYAMEGIKWGAWSDTHMRIDKYWYWGSLRKYAAYVFSGYKSDLNWKCNAILKYTNPCKGCSRCYSKFDDNSVNMNRRWWHAFLPKKQLSIYDNHIDYSKVINEDCDKFYEMSISTTELYVRTKNMKNVPVQSTPSLKIALGPENISYFKFVENGWKQEMDNELPVNSILDAKDIQLYPEAISENRMFYIDYEEYELKPVQIRLLPQSVTIFCPESNS